MDEDPGRGELLSLCRKREVVRETDPKRYNRLASSEYVQI